MLSDTHCHLNLSQFDNDLRDVIARAEDEGIRRILVPGIDIESSRRAVELADQFEIVYAAIGVHPESAANWNDQAYKVLESLCTNSKVVAIGEIGLDDYWKDVALDKQYAAFRDQLDLASRLDLPVSIHSRQAEALVLEEIKSRMSDKPVKGVLHAFGGRRELAEQGVSMGMMIGFGGPLTYRSNEEGRLIVRSIPVENTVLETDSPYLSPVPYRGKRNEPANIALIVEKLAEICDLQVKSLSEVLWHNANRLFKWSSV